MKNRIVRLALLTSPILALYGMSPVFLFLSLQLRFIIIALILLSLMIFSTWLFNIFLLVTKGNIWLKYAISFLTTFVIHSIIIFFIPAFPRKLSSPNFLAYPIIATIAINSVILIIINFEQLRQRNEDALISIQQLSLFSLQAQQRVLMQQLQPHFLFNALSTLKALINEHNPSAENYTVRLADFLRYSIRDHDDLLVTLNDELTFAGDYIALQKTRFGEAIQFHVHVPEWQLSLKLPVFSLQTLVENAIKHNKYTTKKPLIISISSCEQGLIIVNNKTFKQNNEPSGRGLKNLKERYQLVTEDGIRVVDNKGEFSVYLKLLHS